jgi:hypothetical protein
MIASGETAEKVRSVCAPALIDISPGDERSVRAQSHTMSASGGNGGKGSGGCVAHLPVFVKSSGDERTAGRLSRGRHEQEAHCRSSDDYRCGTQRRDNREH